MAKCTQIRVERTLANWLFETEGGYVWRCCNAPLPELDLPTFHSVDDALAFAKCQDWTVQSGSLSPAP